MTVEPFNFDDMNDIIPPGSLEACDEVDSPALPQFQPKQDLLARIDLYFQLGGLFNPEMAMHEQVAHLLYDCREYIKEH